MIEQVAIGICGIASVFLSQSQHWRWQRFACLFGLAAQPFWFYATFKACQWGILFLSLIYTFGWMRGVYNFWILPRFK